MFPPPSQNAVGVCKQITLLTLYSISSRLVTNLKITDAPMQVPNNFYLTVSVKFLKTAVGVCKQITLLTLYSNSFRLVTHLNITDTPMQVPNIFYLTLSFKFLKFIFQIFLLFVPEMSASFMSYTV